GDLSIRIEVYAVDHPSSQVLAKGRDVLHTGYFSDLFQIADLERKRGTETEPECVAWSTENELGGDCRVSTALVVEESVDYADRKHHQHNAQSYSSDGSKRPRLSIKEAG